MILHFFDTRTQDTIIEIAEATHAPRIGETVCFTYNEALDSGMWEVADVTWNYSVPALGLPIIVDVELTPYNKDDWVGSADAHLGFLADRERREASILH